MADYRTYFDNELLGAWDLQGRDVTVTIKDVVCGKVGHGKQASKKPILSFERTEKRMSGNKTNAKIIAAMYGTDTKDWIGKRITLYPTQTTYAGQSVDCIRVRPMVPTGKSEGIVSVERPEPREPNPLNTADEPK